MASIFDERERAYESKWVHDQELHFEIMVQRNALLARWVADLLLLPAEQKERYVQSVVDAGIANEGADHVFQKVRSDLIANGIHFPDSAIHRKMKDLYELSEVQVMKKPGK